MNRLIELIDLYGSTVEDGWPIMVLLVEALTRLSKE